MIIDDRPTAPRAGRGGQADVSIEDKYDEVRHLIAIGKEKGYLLYDEVSEVLPADITSSAEELEGGPLVAAAG